MLTKILVTALVIFAAYFYIRHKNRAAETSRAASTRQLNRSTPAPAAIRWLATSLLVLSLVGAVGFFIYNWNDNRTLMNVRVINPQTGAEVAYQVYKGDLKESRFMTIQGQQVRIANSERLEVSESR